MIQSNFAYIFEQNKINLTIFAEDKRQKGIQEAAERPPQA